MNVSPLLASILLLWIACEQSSAYGITRMPDLAAREPSCEQLKAMWRFSKRQSRASEITNELPTFVDPFAYNVWNPIYTARSRSFGGFPMVPRYRSRPIYGRVVQSPGVLRLRDGEERNRAFEEIVRMYGQSHAPEPRRRLSTSRVAGGHALATPRSGSFQHLKNLIKSERARELHNQHSAEEDIERSIALNRESGRTAVQHEPDMEEDNYDDMEDDYEQMDGEKGLVVFPDVLAPGSHTYQDDLEAYYRENPYKRARPSPMLVPGNFKGEMDAMMI